MKGLKGTKTEANLMAAFSGESMARNKYDYYASKAKKDGYVQISNIFAETANNEKEHAKMWFKLLHDGIPDTLTNLKDAASGENFEWVTMYAGLCRGRGERGLHRDSPAVPRRRRYRKDARGALSETRRQHREQHGFQEG